MSKINLPGAENFAKYLEENLNGQVEVVSYENGNETTYQIFLNGYGYGVYSKIEQKEGETDFQRHYFGKVPRCISPQGLEILLAYDNWEIVDSEDETNKAEFIQTEWKRKDKYPMIPFP